MMTVISNQLKLAVNEGITPGFSLVKVQQEREELIYFGKMSVTSPFPVTSETLYDLASLTKVVGTTSRLLQLIDEEKLGYETKISQIFPDYPNLEMTVAEVMLHNAGFIPDFTREEKKYFSKETLWQYFTNFHYQKTEKTDYSDLSFLLLGEVITRLDAMNLEKSFQKHIFTPLGMTESSYYPKDKNLCAPTEVENLRGEIQGLVHDSKAFNFKRPTGHAGLFSNGKDIGKFLKAFLAGKIFSKDRLMELLQKDVTGRSYGWNLYKRAGRLYHTGFTGGLICIDFKRQKALALLSNSINVPNERKEKRFVMIRHQICEEFFS